jgi:hypothetical protein
MPDTRSVPAGKAMRIIKLSAACFASFILLGLSCPSPESFPRPPLSAPAFSGAELTVVKFDTYRPAVHLRWKAPASDSLAVREFVILQKSVDSSVFSILVKSIPDSITDYYDNLDRIVFPQARDFTTLQYRIYAIDALGRPGDTSAIDSVVLAWPPNMLWPTDKDSVRPDSLVWVVQGVEMGYFTYVSLYSDSAGLIWKSPRPDTPTYSTENSYDHIVVPLPGSLSLLSGTTYYWAVNVEIPTGQAWSIAVGRFYVP